MRSNFNKTIFALGAALALATSSKAQTVSTIATLPSGIVGIAVGKLDTVYVANESDFRIRKIDPTGAVSVFVGTGGYASTDGTGTAASILQVYDMKYSQATGNLYFTQYSGGQVRKVSPGGVVTTLATVSGQGIGIALGQNDTLYTYSLGTGAFNRVDPTGTVTLLATLPSGGVGLSYKSRDTIYLAGNNSNRIYQISGVSGLYSTLAGSGSSGYADGTGAAASFRFPTGLVVDGAGDIYVADYLNNRIRKVSPAGVVTTYAGSGTASSTDGTGTAASFSRPWGINISPSTGNLYVAEYSSGAIRRITGAVPLPLSWLSMSASLTAQGNALPQWQVNEKEVQAYQILKSSNGRDFESIANIGSQGNGNNSYSYKDPQMLIGKAYYRIRQIDISGSQSQSGTMMLHSDALSGQMLQVYPTIFTEGIQITSTTAQNIIISNQLGQIIKSTSIATGTNYIALTGLAAGSYYVQSENGSVQTIVKQ